MSYSIGQAATGHRFKKKGRNATHTSQYLCYSDGTKQELVKVDSSLNVCDTGFLHCLRPFNTALGDKQTQGA